MKKPSKVSFRALAAAFLMLVASNATAQEFQPFADLGVEYDMQWFAPPIVDEYGGETVEANIGWYFEYNRFYLNLSAPENSQTPFDGDWVWGNRYDFGYMTEERHGWLVSVWKVNQSGNVRRTNVTDIQGNAITLTNNINRGNYGGVEVNKTFRSHPYPYEHRDTLGVYFEPFFGFRFGQFNDHILQQSLVFDNPANPTIETAVNTTGQWENNMVGFQVGNRMYIRRGHWIISGEGRGFGMQNFQFLTSVTNTVISSDDGAGNITVQNPLVNQIDDSFGEFVVGGELRVEAAYEITREVRLQVGFQCLYLGRGIGRGLENIANNGVGTLNDQAVSYVGMTMGFEINR